MGKSSTYFFPVLTLQWKRKENVSIWEVTCVCFNVVLFVITGLRSSINVYVARYFSLLWNPLFGFSQKNDFWRSTVYWTVWWSHLFVLCMSTTFTVVSHTVHSKQTFCFSRNENRQENLQFSLYLKGSTWTGTYTCGSKA